MIADIILKVAGMEQDFWEESYRPRPSAAGRCIRALTYRRMGLVPEPWPDRFPVVFDDGNWHEELTLEWLSKSAFKIHDRQMVVTCGIVNGQPMTGHIEGIIEDLAGQQYLFEHKAINHFSFGRYEKLIELGEGMPRNDPYYIQCQLYLCSPTLSQFGIDTCILLIKNKNTGQYREFIFGPDNMVAREAIAQLNNVERNAESGQVPDRPYNRDVDWQCSYCRYERRCWEGYEGERTGPAEVDDPELVGLASHFEDCRVVASGARKDQEEAKKALVHKLDSLKLSEVQSDGWRVTWQQKHRKGYEVPPGTYYELAVRSPKKGGKKS